MLLCIKTGISILIIFETKRIEYSPQIRINTHTYTHMHAHRDQFSKIFFFWTQRILKHKNEVETRYRKFELKSIPPTLNGNREIEKVFIDYYMYYLYIFKTQFKSILRRPTFNNYKIP